MAVSYSPKRGGEADVEEEAFTAAACPCDRGGGDGNAYHKSVLAVAVFCQIMLIFSAPGHGRIFCFF